MTGDVQGIAEQVRDAARRGVGLRIAGAGSWLDAGRPVRTVETLSLASHAGVVEYVPGDLTLTARAGTTLREIAEVTRAHGQWLPLDAPGTEDGTIGATIATASWGPLATAFGTPRDHVVGLEFVTGAGDVVRGGGRVVKNVAGFDLVRLNTGAWGTLGAITEVTVRLRALPAAMRALAVAVPDAAGLARALGALRALPASPYACELLNAPLAHALALGTQPTLLVRVGGNAELVRALGDAVLGLDHARAVDESMWARLREVTGGDAWAWRVSRRPSEFPSLWDSVVGALDALPGALVHASPLRGVVRCLVPRAEPAAACAAIGGMQPARVIGEVLPDAAWRVLPAPVGDRLSRGIKRAFDPHDVLNPGILGDAR